MSSLVAIGRWIGSPAIRFRVAVLRAQTALVLLAFALPLSSVHWLRRPMVLPGSISVFPSDVVVVLALASWPIARLAAGRRAVRGLRTPVLGIPFVLFAVTLVPGLVRGHERYGASFVGQPLRLLVYAGVAAAIVSLSARETYKGLVAVLYAGTAWQAALGTYSLATGRHQTTSYVLSTGGTRVLALSASLFVAGTILLALVNLDLDMGHRRWLHLAIIPVAAYALALSYGRTAFAALIVALVLLVLQLKRLRGWLRRNWWAPALAILAVAAATPLFASTLVDRLTSNPLHDQTVRWRVAAAKASLAGLWSGDWQTVSPTDPTRERLANVGFEHGTEGWSTQGGSISTVPSDGPAFGARSLRFVTDGRQTSEGPYSSPVLTAVGQSWTFSVWLKGEVGGELLNVGLWSYGDGRSPIVQANLPVTLTTTPTRYVVSTVITDRRTSHIRALVRTRERPEAVTVIADRASLKSVRALTGPRGVASAPALPAGGWVQQVLGGDGKPHDLGGAPEILDDRNYLTNGGFENGMAGWSTAGATTQMIDSHNPAFGSSTLELATAGSTAREGVATGSVPARRGQTWLFAIWLKGFESNQRVSIAIRQYDRRERLVTQSVAPFTLNPLPAQYYVASTVTDPRTTHVRAFVETRGAAEAIKLDADSALLGVAAPNRPAPQPRTATAPPSAPAAAGTHGAWRDGEPLIGLGFGRELDYIWEGNFYHLRGDPHNSFVWLLAGGGALALGAFLFLLTAFARDAWRRAQGSEGVERALVLWALAMCLVLMINALAEPLLSDPPMLLAFWVVMLLPALVRRPEPDRVQEEKRE